MKSRTVTALAATAALATTLVASAGTHASAAPNPNSVAKLTQAVTLDGVMYHLEALQEIADDNGGNRAAGLPGYQASVDYVVEQLEAAGYDPTVQEFLFDYFEENSELERLSPNPTTFVNGDDFLRNAFDSGTPEGDVTGTLWLVDLVPRRADAPAQHANSGCEAADFAGFAGRQHRAHAARHLRVQRQGLSTPRPPARPARSS